MKKILLLSSILCSTVCFAAGEELDSNESSARAISSTSSGSGSAGISTIGHHTKGAHGVRKAHTSKLHGHHSNGGIHQVTLQPGNNLRPDPAPPPHAHHGNGHSSHGGTQFIVVNPGGHTMSGNGATHGNAWWKHPSTNHQTSHPGATGTTHQPGGTGSQITSYPRPTLTPQLTPTPTPHQVPGAQPIATPIQVPHQVPTAIPHQQPHPAPHQVPFATPQAIPTQAPMMVPTAHPHQTPQPTPHQVPQATPQAQPHLIPTLTPTAIPQAQPTLTPHQVPTATPGAIPYLTPQQIQQVHNLGVNPNLHTVLVGQSIPSTVPRQLIITQNHLIVVPNYNQLYHGTGYIPYVNVHNNFDSRNALYNNAIHYNSYDYHVVITGVREPTKAELAHYQGKCYKETRRSYKDSA